MKAARKLALLCALASLPACSTFKKDGGSAGGDQVSIYSDPSVIEMQTKLARLETENARLTNRVLELERENEKLHEPEEVAVAEDAAPKPVASSAQLREPSGLSGAVVDNPQAPEVAKTEVPVESAPRLVQPTFAATDSVFENEAAANVQATPGAVLYGVHLASYRGADAAREGWGKLQRENPDELGLLDARLKDYEDPSKGHFLRLIGGGFSSPEKAEALCASLKTRGVFCTVMEFSGQKLSLSESG